MMNGMCVAQLPIHQDYIRGHPQDHNIREQENIPGVERVLDIKTLLGEEQNDTDKPIAEQSNEELDTYLATLQNEELNDFKVESINEELAYLGNRMQIPDRDILGLRNAENA